MNWNWDANKNEMLKRIIEIPTRFQVLMHSRTPANWNKGVLFAINKNFIIIIFLYSLGNINPPINKWIDIQRKTKQSKIKAKGAQMQQEGKKFGWLSAIKNLTRMTSITQQPSESLKERKNQAEKYYKTRKECRGHRDPSSLFRTWRQ